MCASLKKKTRYRNWIFFPFLHHNSTRFCCVFFFHFLTQVPECGMRIARLPGVSLFCDSVLSCCYFFISLLVFFSFLLVFLLPSAVIAGAPAFQAPRLPTIRQKISHTQKKKIINKETLSQDRRTSWLIFFLWSTAVELSRTIYSFCTSWLTGSEFIESDFSSISVHLKKNSDSIKDERVEHFSPTDTQNVSVPTAQKKKR